MTAAAVRPEQPVTALTLSRAKVSGIMLSEEARQQIIPLLPHGMSLERVVSEVNRAVVDNPDLLECTPASLIMAVSTVVRWDLVIGETAHLVPFNTKVKGGSGPDRWEKKAKALRDWKGDIELVIKAGAARAVDAQCFYENEPFKYEQGTSPFIEHHPIVDGVKRGKMLGAYAWARINVASIKIMVMSVEEIDAIRQAKSQSWKAGPVPDWYARKTLIHQVTKAIPKNPKLAAVLRQFDEEDEEIPDADFEVVNGKPTVATTAPETPAADYLTPPDDDVMTLEQAKLTKLAGPPGSWSGKAGELLDSFSSKHLESIRTWCAKKIEEVGTDELKESMVNAITLILDDREKNPPLQFDATRAAADVEAKQNAKRG